MPPLSYAKNPAKGNEASGNYHPFPVRLTFFQCNGLLLVGRYLRIICIVNIYDLLLLYSWCNKVRPDSPKVNDHEEPWRKKIELHWLLPSIHPPRMGNYSLHVAVIIICCVRWVGRYVITAASFPIVVSHLSSLRWASRKMGWRLEPLVGR